MNMSAISLELRQEKEKRKYHENFAIFSHLFVKLVLILNLANLSLIAFRLSAQDV